MSQVSDGDNDLGFRMVLLPLSDNEIMPLIGDFTAATTTCSCESNQGKTPSVAIKNGNDNILGREEIPLLQDSFAPVASSFVFYNHAPTTCVHVSGSSSFETNYIDRSLHRLRDQKSRNRKFRKWIDNIHSFRSTRQVDEDIDETEWKNESVQSNINFMLISNWRSLPSFLPFDWNDIRVPSLSEFICNKEWEEDFLRRKGVVHDSGSTTWWDGRTTIYSIAKDSICSRTVTDLEDQISAATLSARSEENVVSPYTQPNYQLSYFDSNLPRSNIENDQNQEAEVKGTFNLCQTSLFHDTLRIRVDMGSQFAFAIVFIWLMHYAYLCIVVYVLRDNSHTRTHHRERRLAETATDEEPRLDYELTFTSSFESLHKRAVEDDHSQDGDEGQVYGTTPPVRNDTADVLRQMNYSEGAKSETGKTHIFAEDSLINEDDQEVSSEESRARAEMGLPKYITIEQPSYLTTLCMLESDTDDDDSVISSIDGDFIVSS